MLIDLEPQATLLVILGKLAQLRILLGISQQALLQVSIVGINFSKVIVFIEVELGDFLLFVSPVFINPPVICEILSALEPGKWGSFRTEKVRTTYASSALSLSATNGNYFPL